MMIGCKMFWCNILCVVEGFVFCYDVGIVYGVVSEYMIFLYSDEKEDF